MLKLLIISHKSYPHFLFWRLKYFPPSFLCCCYCCFFVWASSVLRFGFEKMIYHIITLAAMTEWKARSLKSVLVLPAQILGPFGLWSSKHACLKDGGGEVLTVGGWWVETSIEEIFLKKRFLVWRLPQYTLRRLFGQCKQIQTIRRFFVWIVNCQI